MDLLEIACRAPAATLCLTSALARHGLTDEIPSTIDVALPRGRHRPVTLAPVTWHLFDPATFPLGREELRVDEQTTIGVYGPIAVHPRRDPPAPSGGTRAGDHGPEAVADPTRILTGGPSRHGHPLSADPAGAATDPGDPAVTTRPTRATTAGRVYLDLQNLARRQGRPTDELHQLYALEGFLDPTGRLTPRGHLRAQRWGAAGCLRHPTPHPGCRPAGPASIQRRRPCPDDRPGDRRHASGRRPHLRRAHGHGQQHPRRGRLQRGPGHDHRPVGGGPVDVSRGCQRR